MAISAASLYQDLDPKSIYFDKRSGLSQDQYKEKLSNSTTLYVGNLSFYTSETQLLEFFQLCGEVVNLIMGLNREKKQIFYVIKILKFKQPCGFCFVEYATREEAALAIECLNLSVVDGRQIRIDWDPGFEPGRQYGRGKSGGQVRDELKPDFADKDRPVQRPQRGGYQRYSGGNYDSNRGGYRGGHGGGNYRNSDRSDYNRGGDRGNNYDNNNYRKRQDNDGGDDENNDNDSKRKRFRRDYSNDRNRNNNNDRDHDMN